MNELSQSICKRCGRKLTTQKSIELGFGEVCWKKWLDQDNHKKLWKEKYNGI